MGLGYPYPSAGRHDTLASIASLNCLVRRFKDIYLNTFGGWISDEQKQKATFMASAKELFKAEGMSGFYRGLIPSLVMVCNPAISFMFYGILVSIGV